MLSLMAILVIDFSYQTGALFLIDTEGNILKTTFAPKLSSLSLEIHHLIAGTPLKAIALPTGPGAFTPLRLTASAAFALSLALNIPLIPYPSFLGLVPSSPTSSNQTLFLDARSQSAFTTTFSYLPDNQILFSPVTIVPSPVERTYLPQPEQLAPHILRLFHHQAFSTPSLTELDYFKHPR